MSSEVYAFGPFRLDVDAFRLSRDGEPLDLQPKQLELLIRLVRAAGERVDREEVHAELWPDVVVTEHSLRTLVYRLRQVLGPEHEQWIETIPRRGFRFGGPVSRVTADAGPPPLPAERDPFVGREADLAALAARFDEGARLVTVVGPGGVGKTRLALQYARGLREGAVFFADLTTARTAEDVGRRVADALDVRLGAQPVAQIGHALASHGRCVVLLDNFEQVAAHAADTVGAWLDRAADARFLVTSREVLGLGGEVVHPLAPLGRDDARALFDARAAAAGGAEGAPEVVDALTELLDRLPLAIELAAARAGVLSASAILERMGDRFRLLGSARSGRHATLRATLDWSWELLGPDEQRALAQLTVFDGGFSLRSAEAVLALETTWPVDALQALVHKSLVVRRSSDRYGLLMSVQDYARAALDEASARAAERRHGQHFAAVGTQAEHERGRRPVDALAIELPNLVAASRRAVDRGDGPVAVATARAAWQVALARGPFAPALELLLSALTVPLSREDELAARTDAGAALQKSGRPAEAEAQLRSVLRLALAPAEEAAVRTVLGTTMRHAGRVDEARSELERAVACAAGDPRREAAALAPLGVLHHHQGRIDDAERTLEASLDKAAAAGDRIQHSVTLLALGVVRREQGRGAEARACFEQALATYRELGDEGGVVAVLASAASARVDEGRIDEAIVQLQEVIRLFAAQGDVRNVAIERGNLGSAYLSAGRLEPALACYEQALAGHRAVGNRRHEGVTLGNLAEVHARLGRVEAAREAAEAAIALHRSLGQGAWEGLARSLLGALEPDPTAARAQLERAEALVRDTGHAVLLGVVLSRRASLEHRAGDAARARRSLDEAIALADRIGPAPDTLLRYEVDRARQRVTGAG